MRKLICLVSTVLNYLNVSIEFIDGHSYVLVMEDLDQQILVCERCGRQSIGYFGG